MPEIIDARVRQKTDILTNWLANPLILLEGEQAFVVNTSGAPINFRIGDGTKRFSELPDWISYAANLVINTIAPGGTLSAPAEAGKITFLQPGTYNQPTTGTLTVPNSTIGIAFWNGSAWSLTNFTLTSTPLPNSPWFIPKTGVVYSDVNLTAINAIKYYYCTDVNISIYQLSKGQTGVADFIGIQTSSTNRVNIPRGTDTGIKYYQTYFGANIAIIAIDWDLLPDLTSGYYISSNAGIVTPTNKRDDDIFSKTIIQLIPQPSSATGTLTDYFYFEKNNVIYKASPSPSTIILYNTQTTQNTKIAVRFWKDSANGNACSIGFGTNGGTANRILFGYEPSVFGIVIYIQGVGFKNLIPLSAMPASGWIDLSVVYQDGEILATYNGITFNAKSYGDTSFLTPNDVRIQLKIQNADFKFSDFNITRLTQDAQITANTLIYKTGDARGNASYNDWCFVKTPVGYNPHREKPYPFVICNHGNSWVMDGTPATANYMITTQWGVDTQNSGAYMNTAAPYYNLYSNEMIERLLEDGYIVCGAENYSNAEYGSDKGRNAMQDFYYHMVNKYNVEKKCFLIGASNGGLMSLNGVFLLGIEKIKAIVLQYPLTNLFRHYRAYAPHRAAINAIYGLSGSETDEQLHQAFNDHDPEYANSVAVTGLIYKSKLWPPTKTWWSSTDTVAPSTANSQPTIAMIQRSYGKIESVQIDAGGGTMEHGDWRHVDPVAVLAFFNKYR